MQFTHGKLRLFFGILVFLGSMGSACENSSPVPATDWVFRSGTSFGMCLGPCRQETTWTADRMVFEVFTSSGRGGANPIRSEFSEQTAQSFWREAVGLFQASQWTSLEPVQGCPDCADGGAEWIEWSDGSKTHRVTFEYGSTLKGHEKFVNLMREEREKLRKKYVPDSF